MTAPRITADIIADAWDYYPWFPGVAASASYDALTVDYRDAEGDGAPINGRAPGAHVISGAALRRAAADIISGAVRVSPRVADDIATGEIDADAADVVLQVAMFGEVVFG
jgi:hypothetical protein